MITERAVFHPLRTGLTLATTLRRLYPDSWQTGSLNRLLADERTRDGILADRAVAEIRAGYEAELEDFKTRREAFLLYE